MKMYFFISILSISSCSLSSCNNENKLILLKKGKFQEAETIEYSSSKKYGNYINAVGKSKGMVFHYDIKLTSDGRLLSVNKYDNYLFSKEENLEFFRHLQLLVTDTSVKKNAKIFYDPNFFGNSINGYYSGTMSNKENNLYDKISRGEINSILTPISTEEKRLFTIIDSLSKSNSIKYNGFDTSKVLGWFKYIF